MGASAAAEEPHNDESKPGLEAVPDSDELIIDVGNQLSMVPGGRKADQSTLTLQGGEVAVEGQFSKGERVKFEVEGVVSEITFTDLMDRKTGDVTATKRKHVLKLDGIKKVEG